MPDSPLVVTSEATFTAAGEATLEIGPAIYTEEWSVERMIVTSTSSANTEVRVYNGSVSDQNLVDGSYSGNQDVSETGLVIRAPQRLTFRWVNGTSGAKATARLEGSKRYGVR